MNKSSLDKVNPENTVMAAINPTNVDESTLLSLPPSSNGMSVESESVEITMQQTPRVQEKVNIGNILNHAPTNGAKKRILDNKSNDDVSLPKKGNVNNINEPIASSNPALASLLKNKYSAKSQAPFIVHVQGISNKALHPLMIVSRQGIIKNIPVDMSDQEILEGLSSPYKIIGIKRLNRRVVNNGSGTSCYNVEEVKNADIVRKNHMRKERHAQKPIAYLLVQIAKDNISPPTRIVQFSTKRNELELWLQQTIYQYLKPKKWSTRERISKALSTMSFLIFSTRIS